MLRVQRNSIQKVSLLCEIRTKHCIYRKLGIKSLSPGRGPVVKELSKDIVPYSNNYIVVLPTSRRRSPFFSTCSNEHCAQNRELLKPKGSYTTDVIMSASGEIIDKTVSVDPHIVIGIEAEDFEDIDPIAEDVMATDRSEVSYVENKEIPNHVKEGTTGVKFMHDVPDRAKFIDGQKLTHWEESKVISAVEGFIFLKMTNDAMKALNVCLRRGHVFQIETYNKLLQCAVTAKDTAMTRMILENMKSQKLERNLHTYAVLLQMLEQDDDISGIKQLLIDMKENGYNVNSLFHKCPLTVEQGKLVYDAVRRIHPGFILQSSHKSSLDNVTTRLVHGLYPQSDITPAEVCSKIQEQHVSNANVDRFDRVSPDVATIVNEDVSLWVDEQLRKETNYYTMIDSVETKLGSEKRLVKQQKLYSKIHQNWKEKFVQELKDMTEVGKSVGQKLDTKVKNAVFPYLCLLEPEQYADIVLNETIPILATQTSGISSINLCKRIGDMIFNVYSLRFKEYQGCHNVIRDVYTNYGIYGADPEHMTDIKPCEMWNFCEGKDKLYSNDKHSASLWPFSVKLMASAVLLDILKKVALIEVKAGQGGVSTVAPAIQHEQQFAKRRFLGVIKVHPVVSRLYKSHLAEKGQLALQSSKIPMVVPPKPWTSITHGGFLVHPSPFVRTVLDEYGHNDLKTASDNGNLNSIFDAVNYVASCPWKINKRILEIMVNLFNDKGDPHLEISGPISSGLPKLRQIANMTLEEKAAYLKERKKLKKVNNEMYSLRMGQLYHLSVAGHLKDRLFWLPCNLDFRGRVYTIPPYCTHIGNDVTRGLMLFGKGKPLGKEGLQWLKIHLVNLHGAKKKSPFTERLNYANEMMVEIMDSADNPLGGRQWWKTAEEPWQFLSTCMEVTNAVRSPDPENFISYLPVHQDGSCNGLQHYAALGRDQYGAEKVNVSPNDHPQDVYSEVAHLVEKQRLQDAANGHELAIMLEGKVSRKVVKQTVMTIVYGVTLVGGRLQIEKQLADISDFDRRTLFKSSTYLVKTVFASIGQLFNSARNIQNWLTRSAADICAAGRPVSWVSPLGLPIVQPYHMKTKELLETPLQYISTRTRFDETRKPDAQKQKGGFPPNYIHSLDSTHMLLTALHCQKEGILFASVHDSFWTHASDVSAMGRICREQFFQLHSEPLLKDLERLFQERYGSLMKKGQGKQTPLTFDDLPDSGTFDLKKVLESTYFFS